MRVRSLVTEWDVTEGKVYNVADVNLSDDGVMLGVDVIDGRDDNWFLTIHEYEVVEE